MPPPMLAKRMGLTTHQSPLRYKLRKLLAADDSASGLSIEEWLLDVANARGAAVITRPHASGNTANPPLDVLTDEELTVACCQLNAADHPQLLRPAAQLISRGKLDFERLILVARRERAERLLAELARQALIVEPDHAVWKRIAAAFSQARALPDVLIHWTRLAEPVMTFGQPGAQKWRLIS